MIQKNMVDVVHTISDLRYGSDCSSTFIAFMVIQPDLSSSVMVDFYVVDLVSMASLLFGIVLTLFVTVSLTLLFLALLDVAKTRARAA